MDNKKIESLTVDLSKEIVDLSCKEHIKENMKEIITVLIKNTLVKELVINQCDLGDEEISELAEVIKKRLNFKNYSEFLNTFNSIALFYVSLNII